MTYMLLLTINNNNTLNYSLNSVVSLKMHDTISKKKHTIKRSIDMQFSHLRFLKMYIRSTCSRKENHKTSLKFYKPNFNYLYYIYVTFCR